MTTITANGYPVLEGAISAPCCGAWWAEIQTRAPLADGDTAVISDGSTNLAGTVVDGGLAESRTVARIVGGSGGLRSPIQANHWRNATLGKVLGDICSSAGESKSLAIEFGALSASLPFWSHPGGLSAGSAVKTLAESQGLVFRVTQGGTVWLGDPSKGLPEPEYTVLEPHPEDRSYDVAPESLSLWVGKLQGNAVVQRVEYSLGENLRCTYWI